jgi:predicted ATPase
MKISISNFKAFNTAQTFELSKFNLFMGANSTGKSSLKAWFKLLRDNRSNLINGFVIGNHNTTEFDFGSLVNRYSKNDEVLFSVFSNTSIGEAETVYQFNVTKSDSKSLVSNSYGSLDKIFIKLDGVDIYTFDLNRNDGFMTVESRFHLNNLLQLLAKKDAPEIFVEVVDMGSESILPFLNEYDFDYLSALFSKCENVIDCKPNPLGRYHSLRSSFFNRPNIFRQYPSFISLADLFPYEDVSENAQLFDFVWAIDGLLTHLLGVIIDCSDKCSIVQDDETYYSDVQDEIFKFKFEDLDALIVKYIGNNIRVLKVKDEAGKTYGNKLQVFADERWHYLEELGSGLQKFIRLVLNTYIQYGSNYLCIPSLFYEEPENMLHPNLEIRFVDYLIDSFIKRDGNFIIETHSLHMLRAFQLAVAEKRIKAKDVVIYDFSITSDRVNDIRKIEILENGSLSSGFHTGFSDLASDMELKIWEIHNNLVKHN